MITPKPYDDRHLVASLKDAYSNAFWTVGILSAYFLLVFLGATYGPELRSHAMQQELCKADNTPCPQSK